MNIYRSQYFKNILTSLTGTTLSQVISIALSPVVSRLYKPSYFGVLAIYTGVVAIMIVFVELQYSHSVLLTKNKKEEHNIIMVCLIISLLFSFFSILIITVLWLIGWVEGGVIGNWIFVIPFSVFMEGVIIVMTRVLNKYGKYKELSIIQIGGSLSTVMITIFYGVLMGGYEGLFFGYLCSQLLRSLLIVYYSKKIGITMVRVSIKEMKLICIKYIKFPIFVIPSEFLYNWTEQIPVYFFNYFFNTKTIGFFNYGRRMVGLPIGFMTNAVGRVFAQEATDKHRDNESSETSFLKTMKILAIPTLPFFIILFFFSETIFQIVFGEEWKQAGSYVKIMVPLFYLKTIVNPLSYMFIVKNRQAENMIIHIMMFLFIISGMYVGYLINGKVETILYIYSIIYSIKYLYVLIRAYSFAKQ